MAFTSEEFVVLLNHCDLDAASLKAEKLRAEIQALQPHQLTVTPSIGVTAMEVGKMANFATLFETADLCVYAARANGRNHEVARPLVER